MQGCRSILNTIESLKSEIEGQYSLISTNSTHHLCGSMRGHGGELKRANEEK